MDQFTKIFAEEAHDLIANLEKSLLTLHQQPDNQQSVEQVFRIMHTLKGNSSMFGFEAMGQLTHHLETLYEFVRSGQSPLTPALLTITLAAVDHFRNLLNDPALQHATTHDRHNQLLGQVASLIGENGQIKTTSLAAQIDDLKHKTDAVTYYIKFRPAADIFSNGTNPLYLLDELCQVGNCRAIPRLSGVPDLENLLLTNCYIHWEVFLATDQGEEAIRDVFIFVEDRCELVIQKIADTNLLLMPAFIEQVKEWGTAEGDEIALEVLQSAIVSLFHPSSARVSGNVKNNNELKGAGQTKENTTSSIRVAADKLDTLLNLVSELVTTQARLSLFAEEHSSPELVAIAENVEKISRQLRDNTFSICLLPLETIVVRFQRLVRDLSVELGKEVVLITEGTETELDKTIIESLADPLLHILRNSLDHGIEDANTRLQKGKPRQGKILLKAFYSGAHVHIQIEDDGAGISPAKIREKAISKGLIHPEANLSDKELFDLIFLPGFSTAAKITDVSGRGVGMDVVRRKISDLRGEVELQSRVDKGTTITIKVPLTLSILDGLLVRIDHTRYVVPLSVVDKCFEVTHHQLSNTFNNLIVLDGEQVPFCYLRNEFDITSEAPPIEQVVVIRYEDKRVGLSVDAIEGEYQAVLKPLGKLYRQQELISGATILGDGSIALVMDTNKLIKQYSGSANTSLIS